MTLGYYVLVSWPVVPDAGYWYKTLGHMTKAHLPESPSLRKLLPLITEYLVLLYIVLAVDGSSSVRCPSFKQHP